MDTDFGYQANGGYRLFPHERKRFKIRRRRVSAETEGRLVWAIGADGSPIDDHDDVYLLEGRFQDRVSRIDYFHGCRLDGVPTAQLWDEDEALALNMVQLGDWGIAVHCITVLQRKWRNRQWRLCVQPELIRLAKHMLKQVSRV